MLFKEKAQASGLKAGDIRRWWNYMEWSMPGFDMICLRHISFPVMHDGSAFDKES